VVIKNTKINWGGGKKYKKYKKPQITKKSKINWDRASTSSKKDVNFGDMGMQPLLLVTVFDFFIQAAHCQCQQNASQVDCWCFTPQKWGSGINIW